MRPSFGATDRLKRLATSSDSIEWLKQWWQRTFNRTDDERPFMEQPMACVLLRFYRQLSDRLRSLEAQKERDAADWEAIRNLKEALDPTPEKDRTVFDEIEEMFAGVLTSSGDAIWDTWLENVRTGNLPNSWWGPKGPPRKQKKAS